VVTDRPGALAAIGGSPIARLSRVVDAGMGEVWVKLEVDSGLKYLVGELYS
jgi:hypothetical protein